MLARLRRGERIALFETLRRSKVARDIIERIVAQEALRRAHDEPQERVRARTADLSGQRDAALTDRRA